MLRECVVWVALWALCLCGFPAVFDFLVYDTGLGFRFCLWLLLVCGNDCVSGFSFVLLLVWVLRQCVFGVLGLGWVGSGA